MFSNILCMFVFLFLYFCFIFCVFCVFVLFCVLFLRLFTAVCFTNFVQIYRPLLPVGNPTAFNKYHIIYLKAGIGGRIF